MQGSKKPPTSEAVKSEGRHDRPTRPPAAPAARRDERAEPDDEPISSTSHIDVVDVDGGAASAARSDAGAAGITSLKSQLAKLSQQAAAVEKSLDDQRRDRFDALDRLEHATERCMHLEAKVTGLESETASLRLMQEAALVELQTMRAERDNLARAVEAAMTATAELGKLKEENEGLHATLGESMRAGAKSDEEITELRKRQFQAAMKVTEHEKDLARAKEEASKAREAAQKSDQEIVVAREEAMQAREATAKAEDAIQAARAEASKARDEAAKLRTEIATAKEDNTKDRATARGRIDLIERALDEARAVTARTETELASARMSQTRMVQQLEAAVAAAAEADGRARATSAAQAVLEQNVRRLREDIIGAFVKIGHGAPPPPLPPGARARSEAPSVSIAPELVSLPPDAEEEDPPSFRSVPPSFRAVPVSARPASMPVPRDKPLTLELEGDWSAPESAETLVSPTSVPSPASKWVPPPVTSAVVVAGSMPASIPEEPTYASVPPQVHESSPPRPQTAPPAARDELLAQLGDPERAADAALELKQHPDWLSGVPPKTLVAALQSVDYDADRPVFDLARAWAREPLCHALITSLRSEPEARLREHAAWLLKHFAAPSSWKSIADLARSDDEGVQLRRWMLEALDRLAAGRAIGWSELGDVITTVSKHPDAALRDGVVGILVSLDRSEEKRRLLLEILRVDEDEVVLASAVNALASVLPMQLDPAVVERLLGHPSSRVQRSVRDLIERAKQTKP